MSGGDESRRSRGEAESLPRVLCVDDSEAILGLERAALGQHYVVATAVNGREALEKARQLPPACVLLDLSMPELDGDRVLVAMRQDPALENVPVIVVTSEAARCEECLKLGAQAFLAKPVRSDELRATVARVLAERAARRRQASLAVLPVAVGPVELALPLDSVKAVVLEPATRALPGGPRFLSEVFELEGAPVAVLDLAALLDVDHAAPLVDRKLVVLVRERLLLALRVDSVRDPEEFAPGQFHAREDVGGAAHAPLDSALVAIAATPKGPLPVVDPGAFFSPDLLARVPALLATTAARGGGAFSA